MGALAPDTATAELASIAARLTEIGTEREAVGRALNEVEALVATASSDNAAADAQQSVTDANAALAGEAERFVEQATAAAVLRWLIEKHRASAQAPLIARAAALFARVTRRAFIDLVIAYGDDDRPRIVAVRADGTRVGVEGLSEGTRDQLYLALRLGAIAGLANATSPPLVCDDLLITADDMRAGAMLDVLAAASATSQVILFTHHEHLIDVARRAVGVDGFRLHRIQPIELVLAA